jgi:hypothetical protein
MNTSIQWAAKVAHVGDVSLLGTADLAFWTERLRHEDLQLAAVDGRAQLMFLCADLKYMGVRFRELSCSVVIAPPQNCAWREAGYLLRAFNTARSFAFMERVFFSTPYYYGDVRLSTAIPASIQLVERGEVVFAAEMGAAPQRTPSRTGDECWEGPVFLPSRGRRSNGHEKLFVARVGGDTRRYPFDADRDSLIIRPAPENELFESLRDSHFTATEWLVRDDAHHAKSKTYTRARLLGDMLSSS